MTEKTTKDSAAAQLQALYEQVPATRCAQSGECCVLTRAEYSGGYATMFPLYRAEYANIVDYVQRNFDAEKQRRLLQFSEERPSRCPFLGDDHGCTIYPVRPLICRTYAVMNHQSIDETADRHRGQVPEDWIKGFVLRESSMVCPRVTVTEPEKLARHADHLVTFYYERELIRLSKATETGQERRRLFGRLTGRKELPLRWTWGGFNAVCQRPLSWIKERLKAYWKNAELADSV